MVTLLNLMQWEPNLWNNIALPDGVSLQTLVDTIMSEYGNMDVVHDYPDLFMWMNETWFRRKYWSIEKMFNTLHFEYNPIENYRRNEDEWQNHNDDESRNITETHDRGKNVNYSDNVDYSSQDDTTISRNRTQVEDTQDDVNRTVETSSTTTVNNDVSAYNSESYVNDSKTVTETSGTETDSVSENKLVKNTDKMDDVGKTVKKDDTVTTGNSSENENVRTSHDDTFSSDREMKRGLLSYGNIGVTTSQQMIKEEREVSEFDFYWWLAEMWARDNIVLCSV